MTLTVVNIIKFKPCPSIHLIARIDQEWVDGVYDKADVHTLIYLYYFYKFFNLFIISFFTACVHVVSRIFIFYYCLIFGCLWKFKNCIKD